MGLDVSGPFGDCVLKIGLGMSNKKREKDFACLECVIIQSLWAQNPILKISASSHPSRLNKNLFTESNDHLMFPGSIEFIFPPVLLSL